MKQTPFASAPARIRWAAALSRRIPFGRYRLMERMCRRPVPPFIGKTGLDEGGYDFSCDLRDLISRSVYFTGRYDPQETALLKQFLRPGDTFLDIGANWGYFTLLGAHLVGPKGRVVALEPDPRLFNTLRENVVRNHLDQVTPVQLAAADRPGEMVLAGYDETGGNFGLSRLVRSPDAPQENAFTVPTSSLDDLIEEMRLPQVDVMKMDIEGAEGLALRGLAKSLALGRPKRLLLEMHPEELRQLGQTPEVVLKLLRGARYQSWVLPRLNRKIAYAHAPPAKTLLSPFDGNSLPDQWCHFVWIAPGLELVP